METDLKKQVRSSQTPLSYSIVGGRFLDTYASLIHSGGLGPDSAGRRLRGGAACVVAQLASNAALSGARMHRMATAGPIDPCQLVLLPITCKATVDGEAPWGATRRWATGFRSCALGSAGLESEITSLVLEVGSTTLTRREATSDADQSFRARRVFC
jgi:hypothetical protein